MSAKFAKIISWILHPLLMPTYGTFLIFHYNTYISYTVDPVVKKAVYAVLIANTFVFPSLLAWFLYKRGMIRSLHMDTIAERRIPFLATTIFFMAAYYLIKQLPIPRLMIMIMLGATISVIASVIINLKWKISIHLVGIGGVAGALLGMAQKLIMPDLLLPLIFTIFLAGLLGTARLALNAHKPVHIYVGFMIGFLSELLVLIL